MSDQPANPSATGFEFVISREFDVDRATMFQLWTDCKHLLKWFGPKGMPLVRCSNDLRPGGSMHYCMQMPDGSEGWGKWTYRRVDAPEYLEVIVAFSDAQGNVTRNPWKADWPLQTLSRTTFTEQGGKTTVSLRWSAFDATDEERQAFEDPQAQAGMKMGWTGTMDQLEEYVASRAGNPGERHE